MDKTPARYEFRIWGNHLSPIRDQLAKEAPAGAPRESSETYILSRATDTANVKFRGGLLDIKLFAEQAGRLERWRPVLKAGFPLDSRTIVENVFPNLAVAVPHIERPSYTYDEFINELIKPEADLAIVEVTKSRTGFTFERYTAEFAVIGIVGGGTTETVELESEDSAAVLRAIAKLGLNSQPNINYVRHLKLMIGMTPRSTASAS